MAAGSPSTILGDNLNAAGYSRASGEEAHHIVPYKDRRSDKSRQILSSFDIDLNSAENGVFLPGNKATPNPNGKAVHRREDAVAILDYIRQQLQAGRWP
ncbi:AHH domain-containing protein [Amycolatopsis thermoflava]|uniref:AHH domain-containing protein n=1 Tax=Amycolatopsis thermoflava TaxID=84480 RepID=UPI000A07B81F|nr:AHH domain-containing protein [Amycolatopsis thermoflava]